MEPMLSDLIAPGLNLPGNGAPAPYQYLVLDLETSDGRADEAERELLSSWRPNPKLTPQTIGAKYLEALEKKKERLALINDAPIVAVSLRSESELRCMHCLGAAAPRAIEVEIGSPAAMVEAFATSREMLLALRSLLDLLVAEDTLLVGHNILGFDLRKLRWAYLRERLRLPQALAWRDQPVFDLMREYSSRLALRSDETFMVSLSTVLDGFGLPNHKSEMDGAQVPRLVSEGKVDELVAYALRDVLAETSLFLRMAGRNDDEPAAG